MSNTPSAIYIFSGKRKSGKDFFTEQLFNRLDPSTAVIIRLSEPIKTHWADLHGLDKSELLSASAYKENYRQKMILWSEEIRRKDYGYFCRAAIEMSKAKDKPIWIISDARRKTDLKWFKENYKGVVKTFRIVAHDEVRKQRGWEFKEGIDDAESECGLDDVLDWTEEIMNNGNNLESVITCMVTDLNNSIK